MTILNQQDIKREIQAKRLVISPKLAPSNIKGASIDLTLDNDFRVFRVRSQAIDVKESTSYKRYTKALTTNTLVLRPQETVIGITKECITLPDNIVGWLEGRSRFARLGLLIHISAGLIHPGVSNKQVLEITNLSPNILKLHAGEKICQLALQYTNGPINYQGKFRTQKEP